APPTCPRTWDRRSPRGGRCRDRLSWSPVNHLGGHRPSSRSATPTAVGPSRADAFAAAPPDTVTSTPGNHTVVTTDSTISAPSVTEYATPPASVTAGSACS